MRKAIRLVILTLTMVLMSSVSFADRIDVKIEDKQVDFNRVHNGQPIGSSYVENNRTYIPIRVVSEELGYEVTWVQEKQTAIIEKGNKRVEIKIGKTTALVDGVKTPIDKQSTNTKAVIKNGRTYVPVRFISEALGDKVEYRQPSSSSVKIEQCISIQQTFL